MIPILPVQREATPVRVSPSPPGRQHHRRRAGGHAVGRRSQHAAERQRPGLRRPTDSGRSFRVDRRRCLCGDSGRRVVTATGDGWTKITASASEITDAAQIVVVTPHRPGIGPTQPLSRGRIRRPAWQLEHPDHLSAVPFRSHVDERGFRPLDGGERVRPAGGARARRAVVPVMSRTGRRSTREWRTTSASRVTWPTTTDNMKGRAIRRPA